MWTKWRIADLGRRSVVPGRTIRLHPARTAADQFYRSCAFFVLLASSTRLVSSRLYRELPRVEQAAVDIERLVHADYVCPPQGDQPALVENLRRSGRHLLGQVRGEECEEEAKHRALMGCLD